MITSKLFLCNFSCTNVYQAFFYNVKVAKTNCFYFCPHFYEKFVSRSILHQSIIYEQNRVANTLNHRKSSSNLKSVYVFPAFQTSTTYAFPAQTEILYMISSFYLLCKYVCVSYLETIPYCHGLFQ